MLRLIVFKFHKVFKFLKQNKKKFLIFKKIY